MKSLQDGGLSSIASWTGSDPWSYLEQIRELGPVVRDEEMGAWLVTSYELLRQISRDEQSIWSGTVFLDDPERLGATAEEWTEFTHAGSDKTLIIADADEHDRQHRWWMGAFSGQTVRRLGDTLVRPIAHAEIDRITRLDHAELSSDLADRIAPRVISVAMGLPQDEEWTQHAIGLNRTRMALMGRALTPHRDKASDAEVVRAGCAAVRELREILAPHVLARRAGDGDDFISMIWRDAERVYGTDYDEADVVSTVISAFSGGADTTASTTSSGLYHLMIQPEWQQRLRDDHSLVPGFVEEVLRLYGPLPYRFRSALRDTELGGVEIAKGDLVVGLGLAVNRDPERFEHPCEFDADRRAPKGHFSFGMHSTRACPGQGLARAQLAAIFETILDRLENLRLDPDAEPPRFAASFVTRWRPLHATFSARPSHLASRVSGADREQPLV